MAVFYHTGPLDQLVAFKGVPKRKPGRLKGKIRLSDDFDAPMTPEEIAAWERSPSDDELF